MKFRSFRNPAFVIILSSLLAVGSNAALAQTDSRKPPAIESQDVPVVSPALYARLARYQSMRSATFRGWAPDGKGILISTRVGNASQLHRVYEPAGRYEQITFYEEPVVGKFLPNAIDGRILLTMDAGGNENDQVYILDRQKFETTLLTDGKSRNRIGAIRRDGSQMIVASNRRNNRDSDLYVVDPRQSGSMRLVMEADQQSWITHDWSQDGKTVLLSRFVSANESWPALLDLETGRRTELPFPGHERAAVGQMAFSVDGKSIWMATDAGSEFRRLARLDLSTHNYEWLTADIPWDVAEIAVHNDTGQTAFTVNEDGVTRLFLLTGDAPARREITHPLGILSGLEFAPDGKRLGFTLARPEAPPDAYSILLESDRLTRWTFSEVGGLNPDSFSAPTRIQFPSFDGRMIPAYYFKPRPEVVKAHSLTEVTNSADVARAPVYISIHGGPEAQYQPFFSPIIQFYLNELGMAVICPNVRGSSGYGKTYLKLDNAELREDSVKDIGALLDWIGQQPEFDASRIAVAGGSYGGYMALASLTNFGSRIKAGVDVVGIANFVTFLEKTAGYRVDLRRAEYGDERDPNMKALFDKISPLNSAEKISAALLVIHGRNDPRVPFYEAEQIAAKVRSGGRPVWTVFANNEGHGFSKKDNADYARAVEILFLTTHLKIRE